MTQILHRYNRLICVKSVSSVFHFAQLHIHMHIKIHTFGIAKEICGGSRLQLEVPDLITAGELKQMLTGQYPRLGGLASFLLAVNEEFAEPDTVLSAGDELAIIPPVSGG